MENNNLEKSNQDKKNSLGNIIHKTLKTFYPHSNINITPETIQGILNKAGITKQNSKKEEISKIIKILKHHIEISMNQENDKKIVEPPNYTPIFSDMENKNSFLDKQRIEYFDNIQKLREDESKVYNEKTMDIIPPDLRVKNFMEEEKNEFEHFIIIDSKDRDFTAFTSPSEYSIMLGVPNISKDEKKGFITRNYEEVVSLELLQFTMKDTSSVLNASDNPTIPPYITIEIEEIGSMYQGTNDSLSNAFARLTYFDMVEHGTSVKYRHYDIPDSCCRKIFKPRKNLNKLSIKIKLPNGELYSIGSVSDTSNDSMNTFMFKITVLQKNFVSNYIDKTN